MPIVQEDMINEDASNYFTSNTKQQMKQNNNFQKIQNKTNSFILGLYPQLWICNL
jgi:hypothetical protein